jgi:hypothetical protein
MTLIIHNKGDLQIYFCVIFLETRHHVTSGALIDCALSLAAKGTQTARGVMSMISLARACYGYSRVAEHFLCPNLVFQPVWGVVRVWALSGFLSQIPRQKEPEISVIFNPT